MIPELEDIISKETNKETYRLATVAGVSSGLMTVRFDGETEPSPKEYAYLASFLRPTAGARVLMAAVGGTYIALGAISNGAIPTSVPAAAKLATTRQIILSGDLSGSAYFDGTNNANISATVLTAQAVRNVGYASGITFRSTITNKLEFRSGTTWYTLANA